MCLLSGGSGGGLTTKNESTARAESRRTYLRTLLSGVIHPCVMLPAFRSCNLAPAAPTPACAAAAAAAATPAGTAATYNSAGTAGTATTASATNNNNSHLL